MGLGGHLLWTSVVRTINQETGSRVRVCAMPMVSDLIAGRLYRGDVTFSNDEVFGGNPRIEFPPVVKKPLWLTRVDRAMSALIRRLGLAPAYERYVLRLADARARTCKEFHAHIDARAHSYVAEERADRLVWKTGGHIIDIILGSYGLRARDHRCEMYLTPEEEQEVDRVLQRYGIPEDFVVVEPNSKQDWFGDLRAWPVDRWQEVVNRVHDSGRQVVQIGEGGGYVLRHAIDLSGRIPVRIAIGLMKRSRLFLGLEGGLMHAANSVGVPAVIVWGGLTLPEFAGYRELHQVLCSYVECAPCGLRGNCPYGKKCLTTIEVDEVMRAIHHVFSGVGRPQAALRS